MSLSIKEGTPIEPNNQGIGGAVNTSVKNYLKKTVTIKDDNFYLKQAQQEVVKKQASPPETSSFSRVKARAAELEKLDKAVPSPLPQMNRTPTLRNQTLQGRTELQNQNTEVNKTNAIAQEVVNKSDSKGKTEHTEQGTVVKGLVAKMDSDSNVTNIEHNIDRMHAALNSRNPQAAFAIAKEIRAALPELSGQINEENSDELKPKYHELNTLSREAEQKAVERNCTNISRQLNALTPTKNGSSPKTVSTTLTDVYQQLDKLKQDKNQGLPSPQLQRLEKHVVSTHVASVRSEVGQMRFINDPDGNDDPETAWGMLDKIKEEMQELKQRVKATHDPALKEQYEDLTETFEDRQITVFGNVAGPIFEEINDQLTQLKDGIRDGSEDLDELKNLQKQCAANLAELDKLFEKLSVNDETKEQMQEELGNAREKLNKRESELAPQIAERNRINSANRVVIAPLAKELQAEYMNKFVALAVRHKNLSATDPERPQLEAHAKSAINEAQGKLDQLRNYSPPSHLTDKQKEILKKDLHSRIEGTIRVLKSISGHPEPIQLSDDQKTALRMLKLSDQEMHSDEVKAKLPPLLNSFTHEELLQLISYDIEQRVGSANNEHEGIFLIPNRIFQNLPSNSPEKSVSILEWTNSSTLGSQIEAMNEAYKLSSKGLAEIATVESEGKNNAIAGLLNLHQTISEIFDFKSDFPQSLENIIRTSEKKINNASNEKERAQIYEELGKAIGAHFSAVLKSIDTNANTEQKNIWRNQILARIPQYNLPMYKTDIPGKEMGHGFDRIYTQLQSPAASDNLMTCFERSVKAQEKLRADIAKKHAQVIESPRGQ